MTLPFSVEELEAAVAAGDVTKRPHPTLPYFIYNYSPEVQFSKKWNEVTMNCRGLILDHDYNIVARPWKKFFNLGEVNLGGLQFDSPVEIMDKADGSLGILYPNHPATYSGHHTYSIATRGSFTSEQAYAATAIWQEKYDGLHPCDDVTLLFEIIYPSNRIVLDYGDMKDLILLGAVSTNSGYYHSPNDARYQFYSYDNGKMVPAEWPGPVVEVFNYKTISDALGHMERSNAEGYVIRSNNFLVKLKQPDYLELHRLVTNASPRTVWEQLKAGKSKSEIVSAFPDEFHDYIGGMADPLIDAFGVRLNEIIDGFSNAMWAVEEKYGLNATRAQYASVFKKSKDTKYFFSLLDKKRIADVVWTELKPRVEGAANEPAVSH